MKPDKELFDILWLEICGDKSFERYLSVPYCYIKITSHNGSKFSGKGLWLNRAVNWSIDINPESLELSCDCPSMQNSKVAPNPSPCAHLMRALITYEYKLLGLTFEDVYTERQNDILPF